jgi:hypothetical protein
MQVLEWLGWVQEGGVKVEKEAQRHEEECQQKEEGDLGPHWGDGV